MTKKFSKIINIVIVIMVIVVAVFFNELLRGTIIQDDFYVIGFLFIIIVMMYLHYKELKKEDVSMKYLLVMNGAALIHILIDDWIIFGFKLQCIQVIMYVSILVVGLYSIWEVKKKLKSKFIKYLLTTLITIIVCFGGFYETVYSMFFPYGLECFSIDTGMSYSEAALAEDFIFYSADACFGTDLSNVRIRYFDYSDEQMITSAHKDKFEAAYQVMRIAKWTSLIETIIFVVYISMIVVGYSQEKEEK